MKKIFIIGGMGAGKSSAAKALIDCGLSYIDLDHIGHEIHTWDIVKEELVESFGADIIDETGSVNRRLLAQRAFSDQEHTRMLNHITMPRIEDAFMEHLDEYEAKGCKAVVVECSVFKDRLNSMAHHADIIVAVVAPLEQRINRAVRSGFEEEDVRARIAQQITDAERVEEADVVFNNNKTPEVLYTSVQEWWKENSPQILNA